MFIISIGFVLEALTIYFWVIFLSQVIWGLGYTFISGALDSWVSDETNNEDIERTMITAAQIHKLFSFAGIILAAVIGMYNIRLAIYIPGSIFFFLGVYAIIFMKENQFEKCPLEHSIFKSYYIQIQKAFVHVKKSKILRIMFVIMLFFGLFSEGIDRTHEKFILDNLQLRELFDIAPIWILSIINAIVAISGYLLLYVVKKYVTSGRHLVLWAFNLTVMMIVGLLVFTFLPYEYIAVSGFIFFTVTREGTHPLLNAILVKSTPSQIKATVMSGFGQLDAIGQLLSGAIMVGATLLLGIKGMYVVTAMLLLVPVFLFARLKQVDV